MCPWIIICRRRARDEEFTLRFPEYTKFVSQMFETKEEAMEEKAGDGYHLHEMPSDAAEEDPLVFLRTALLSVSLQHVRNTV